MIIYLDIYILNCNTSVCVRLIFIVRRANINKKKTTLIVHLVSIYDSY